MNLKLPPKFVVDACVYIAALDKKEVHHKVSLAFFDAIREKKYRLFAPCLATLEISNNYRKHKRIDARKELLKKGKLQTIIIYFDKIFFDKYSKIMLDLPYIKTADILYATVAKLNSAPFITWNKKHFIKYRSVIDIMTPKEFLKSSYM